MPLQENAGQSKQSISNTANGPTMGMSPTTQSYVAAAALGIVLGGDASPMINCIAEADMRSITPDNETGLAALLSHGSDT